MDALRTYRDLVHTTRESTPSSAELNTLSTEGPVIATPNLLLKGENVFHRF